MLCPLIVLVKFGSLTVTMILDLVQVWSVIGYVIGYSILASKVQMNCVL